MFKGKVKAESKLDRHHSGEGKQIVYIVSDGESNCVFEDREMLLEEVNAILDNAEYSDDRIGEQWIISTDEMTSEEFDALPDFNGY